MRKFSIILGLLSLAIYLTSCSGGNSQMGQAISAQPQGAMIFVTGGDAPLPSVLSFKITLNTLALFGWHKHSSGLDPADNH